MVKFIFRAVIVRSFTSESSTLEEEEMHMSELNRERSQTLSSLKMDSMYTYLYEHQSIFYISKLAS